MDEARYGIFLIVCRGARRDRREWPLSDANQDRELTFAELGEWLEKEAEELLRSNPSLDGLKVVAIDLTRCVAHETRAQAKINRTPKARGKKGEGKRRSARKAGGRMAPLRRS
jgi:hypothetical protein